MSKFQKSILAISLATTLIYLFASPTYAGNLPDIPRATNSTPKDISEWHVSKTVELRKLSSLLNSTDSMGKVSYGMFCTDTKELFYNPQFNRQYLEVLNKEFKERLHKFGYPDYSPGESLFEDKIGTEADFVAGATVQDIKFDVCWKSDVMRGKAYAKIKWEIFANRLQKVVYTNSIEAYIDSSTQESTSELEFNKKLFAQVVDNLLADEKFLALFKDSSNLGNTVAGATLQPMALQGAPMPQGSAEVSQKQLAAAVATIESGVVSGTGFFISDDGYLLTNQNVVGNAKFVKVILQNGRSVVGEVVRFDIARNVALVKTDAAPGAVLALRETPAEVGEEIYSLGSPLGKTLASTFTHGVLSAKRVEHGIDYLQSDVAVSESNEGGPLLDKHGAVIGISQSGLHSRNLNFFTPIGDALDKLALTVKHGN